ATNITMMPTVADRDIDAGNGIFAEIIRDGVRRGLNPAVDLIGGDLRVIRIIMNGDHSSTDAEDSCAGRLGRLQRSVMRGRTARDESAEQQRAPKRTAYRGNA